MHLFAYAHMQMHNYPKPSYKIAILKIKFNQESYITNYCVRV
jgi:hypothetical protein